MQKLVSFCEFVFVVPNLIAHKMVITSNFVSQTTLVSFKKQPKTNQKRNSKKSQKHEKLNHFEPKKTPKNDLLTLNKGHPSSCTTISN